MPSGREAPCRWKPLSRPIGSPRRLLCTSTPESDRAASRACQPGRKKLIFSSTVVKDSSGARVLANAMPIAVSAISQRIPPCSVPMGFACCGPSAKTTVARPAAMSFALNPIRRPIGTAFVCSFPKVGLRGKFVITINDLWLWPSISARELLFRGIPPDDGRQDREALPSAADDSPYGCLRACWQSR
jgi:hypothetical protein